MIDLQLVRAPQALAGKRLVDLKDVDVLDREACLLQSDRDGFPRANAHEERRHADDGCCDVLAEDLLAERLSGGALHEQHGGRAVRDLRSVAGVDGAVFGERRPDLAEGLDGDFAHAVVSRDGDLALLLGLGVRPLDLQGRDLLVEPAVLLRLGGLAVAVVRELVLALARDVAVLGHLLGERAHGHLALGGFLVVLEQVAELCDGAGAVLGGHALDAGADADLDGAALDRVGDVDAGLQAGRALPVQRLDGGRAREASGESGSAELGGSTAGSKNIAHSDVFDEGGVDSRALDEALESSDEEVSAGGVFEAATAALCDGGAEGCGDDDVVGVLLDHAWAAGARHVVRDLLEAAGCVLVLAGRLGGHGGL